MPSWLQRQLKEAYLHKDIQRVQLLNQCWFYYKKSIPESKSKAD